jgi:hypothetical protein
MVSVTDTGELTKLELLTPTWMALFRRHGPGDGKVTRHRCEMQSRHTCGDRPALFPIANGPTRDYAIEHPV